jgi:hypothetical protein
MFMLALRRPDDRDRYILHYASCTCKGNAINEMNGEMNKDCWSYRYGDDVFANRAVKGQMRYSWQPMHLHTGYREVLRDADVAKPYHMLLRSTQF